MTISYLVFYFFTSRHTIRPTFDLEALSILKMSPTTTQDASKSLGPAPTSLGASSGPQSFGDPSSGGKSSCSSSSGSSQSVTKQTNPYRPLLIKTAIVVISIVLLVMLVRLYMNNTSTSKDICQSEACREAGVSLRDSINASVNPCDDFYEYACGNWLATHPIPGDMSSYCHIIRLSEKLLNDTLKLLEQPLPTGVDHAKSVRIAWQLYQECIDRGNVRFECWPVFLLGNTHWALDHIEKQTFENFQIDCNTQNWG